MNLHGFIEGKWEDMIESYYKIDRDNERFFYDPYGYPLKDQGREQEYQSSLIKQVFDALNQREFNVSWGGDNKNVWDFMSAVCQHSYLLAYSFLPQQYAYRDVTPDNWQSLGSISFENLTIAVFTDAIDSIARIWLRVWRRYMQWETDKKRPKTS
jgi:hypothetical protein